MWSLISWILNLIHVISTKVNLTVNELLYYWLKRNQLKPTKVSHTVRHQLKMQFRHFFCWRQSARGRWLSSGRCSRTTRVHMTRSRIAITRAKPIVEETDPQCHEAGTGSGKACSQLNRQKRFNTPGQVASGALQTDPAQPPWPSCHTDTTGLAKTHGCHKPLRGLHSLGKRQQTKPNSQNYIHQLANIY